MTRYAFLVLDLSVAAVFLLVTYFFLVAIQRFRHYKSVIRELRARLAEGDDLDRAETVRSLRKTAVLEAQQETPLEERVRWLLQVADELERRDPLA
jgi:hypothetical protein